MSKQRTNDIAVRTAPSVGGYYAQHKGANHFDYGKTPQEARKKVAKRHMEKDAVCIASTDWRTLLGGVRVV